jgi:glutamate-1-semialdehyde aminotransferase
MEKMANIMLGLLNEGVYQFAFGTLLLSASHDDVEIDEFLAKLDRALHAVDLV